jgi:hypothetical protein
MENSSSVLPIGITVVNVILIGILSFLFIYNYRKCFLEPLSSREHAFYKLKLTKTIIFFIANWCALFLNYKLFFLNPELTQKLFGDAFSWIRYIDRGSMLIYGMLKVLDSLMYNPSAYDKLIDQDEFIKISTKFTHLKNA